MQIPVARKMQQPIKISARRAWSLESHLLLPTTLAVLPLPLKIIINVKNTMLHTLTSNLRFQTVDSARINF